VPFGVKIEACGRQTESILVSTLLTYLNKSVMKTLFYPDKNVFQTTGPRWSLIWSSAAFLKNADWHITKLQINFISQFWQWD